MIHIFVQLNTQLASMETYITLNNDNGQGLLRIVPFEIGDYLTSEVPNVVSWYDCRGSVAKYVSLLNETKFSKSLITSILREAFNSGDRLNLSSIRSPLTEFCTLFPSGTLNLSIYDDRTFADVDDEQFVKYGSWSVVYPKQIFKSNEPAERDSFRIYFEEQFAQHGWVPGDIMDLTTSGFYDAFDAYFIFTQNAEQLDKDTVAQYEQLIRNGKRPYCIVYTSEIANNQNNYVIDGHHKLMAYYNLKIRPNFLEITQISEVEAPRFDINRLENDLFDRLYTWQLKHIFDNGIYRSDSFSNLLNYPKNRFNYFVKNGFYEEYWANGKLKSKGNYRENRPQGKVEHFFPTGNAQTIEVFDNGKQLRFMKAWYPNGALQLEIKPHDDILNGEEITYHKSGKISGRKIFKDGKIADGKSVFAYNEDGKFTYEAEYKDGHNVNSKWF